jgi:hypothetical protein
LLFTRIRIQAGWIVTRRDPVRISYKMRFHRDLDS